PRARGLRTRARRRRGHRGRLRGGPLPRRGWSDGLLPRRRGGRGQRDPGGWTTRRRYGAVVPHLLHLDRSAGDPPRGPLRRAGAPRVRPRQGAAGHPCADRHRARVPAAGVDRAALERTGHRLLRVARRAAAGRVGDLSARRGRVDGGRRTDLYRGPMSRQKTVSGSVVIDVDPQVAYAAVSDVTQMGRWSPENLGGTLGDGSDPGQVAVGTPFVGANRRGRAEWVTGCVVTAADPGRRFAFRVHR